MAKAEMSDTERDLQLAAEIGKALLERNNELETKLESTTKNYVSKLEALEQENYSLQRKVECMTRMEKGLNVEVESLRDELDKKRDLAERLQKQNMKLETASKENSELEAQNGQLTVEVKSLREQKVLLERHLKEQEELQESLRDAQGSSQAELQQLQNRIQETVLEKQLLENQVHDLEMQLDLMREAKNHAEAAYQECDERIVEYREQISSYLNALQRANEEAENLRGEVEVLKLEQIDVNRRGNSLFSEVEDHRKKMEKQLISLNVNYKALKEKYEFSQQQLYTMKNQLTILLSFSNKKADTAHIHRLEQSLSQAQTELKKLTTQFNDAKSTRPPIDFSFENGSAESLLKVMLEQERQNFEKAEKERKAASFSRLANMEYAQQLQKDLHKAERVNEHLEATILQQKLKMQMILEKTEVCTCQKKPKAEKEKTPSKICAEEKENVENIALDSTAPKPEQTRRIAQRKKVTIQKMHIPSIQNKVTVQK